MHYCLSEHATLASVREEIILPRVRGKDVLDCGGVGHHHIPTMRARGRWLHALIAEQARSCLGVDIEAAAVEAVNAQGRYRFIAANAEELDFDARFDVVVGGELIEHLSNPGRFLAGCYRALRPGGELILTTPNAFALSGVVHAWLRGREVVHPQHTCYFSPRTLRQLVERSGFRVHEVLLTGRPARWRALEWARALFTRVRPEMAETLVLVATKPRHCC